MAPSTMLVWCRRTFELPAGSERNLAMEGVRGLAVLLVFCAHFWQLFRGYFPVDGWSWKWAHYPGVVGHNGVDLFFILSGYLIYGAVIRKPLRLGKFLTRRGQRIFPAFTAVFLLYAALSALFPAESKIPSGAGPAAAFLLGNFLLLPGIFDIPAMNSVAWSLSYEFFYYLALPLVAIGLGLRRRGARARVSLAAGIALAYLAVWWAAYLLARTTWPVRFRLVMFVFGIAMYELLHSAWWNRKLRPLGELAAIALFGGALAASYQLNAGRLADFAPPLRVLLEVAAVGIGFTALLLYAIGHRGRIHHALSWTPLRWLGNMSYSYYLIHLAALHGVALLLPRVLPFAGIEPIAYLVAVVASFCVTAAAAAVLFVAVERPWSLEPRAARRSAAAGRARDKIAAALAVFGPSQALAPRVQRREEPAP